MHRFFAPSLDPGTIRIDLDEGESRHAVQVLRLLPGDTVELLDGAGRIAEGILEESTRRSARIRVVRISDTARAPIPVHLCVALLKGRGLDLVLEKCVELGATGLSWIDAAHCVSRLVPDEIPRKQAAWRQSLIEAAKQSRNPWLPELRGPLALPRILDGIRTPDDLTLLASLRPGSRPVSRVLEERGASGNPVRAFHLLVGPEGDFTEAEEARIVSAGGIRVSLGPTILRAETAALAMLSVVTNHARR